MIRVLTPVALILAAAILVGCGSPEQDRPATAAVQRSTPRPAPEPALARPNNPGRISPRDLVDELASAGLQTEDMGAPPIDMDYLSRFPEEPRSTMRLRVSDGQGNSSPMTFIEFGSWKTAAAVDAKPINGFAVRNWFVLGIVNNYFVERVTEALDG